MRVAPISASPLGLGRKLEPMPTATPLLTAIVSAGLITGGLEFAGPIPHASAASTATATATGARPGATRLSYGYVYGRTNQAGIPRNEMVTSGSGDPTLINHDAFGQAIDFVEGTSSQYVIYSGLGNMIGTVASNGATTSVYHNDPYGALLSVTTGPDIAASQPKSGVPTKETLSRLGDSTQSNVSGAVAMASGGESPWGNFGIQGVVSRYWKRGARWNDTYTGTWTSVDPVTSLGDPSRANPYIYAGDNPINATDPAGRDPARARPGVADRPVRPRRRRRPRLRHTRTPTRHVLGDRQHPNLDKRPHIAVGGGGDPDAIDDGPVVADAGVVVDIPDPFACSPSMRWLTCGSAVNETAGSVGSCVTERLSEPYGMMRGAIRVHPVLLRGDTPSVGGVRFCHLVCCLALYHKILVLWEQRGLVQVVYGFKEGGIAVRTVTMTAPLSVKGGEGMSSQKIPVADRPGNAEPVKTPCGRTQ